MKRILTVMLALAMLLLSLAACTPGFSPEGGDVSVKLLNVTPAADPVTLEGDDAEQLISYLQNLPDGKEHLCDCLADVSITIGEQTFSYHSDSGVLTEKGSDTIGIYYVGDKCESINKILERYILLGHNWNFDSSVWVKNRHEASSVPPRPLSDAHAAAIIEYTKDLPDGTDYLCDCLPDVTITIGEQTFSYHSDSGVLTEITNDAPAHYYVGENREAINQILQEYIDLGAETDSRN